MEPRIPPVIMLAKERAGSFRRCVEILHQTWEDPPHVEELHIALLFLRDLFWSNNDHFSMESPLLVVDWALRWANTNPPRSADVLREARTALETATKEWAEAFLLIQEMARRRLELDKLWPEWILEGARAASSEALRIEAVLRDSWPVGSQEEEHKALEDIRRNGGMGLDEAFAQVASVSTEDWLLRVEEHKKKRQTT